MFCPNVSCQGLFVVWVFLLEKEYIYFTVTQSFVNTLKQIFSAVMLKIACPRDRGSSCVKLSAYCYIFRISINDTKSVEMTSITYLSKQVEKKNKQWSARESIRIVYLCLSFQIRGADTCTLPTVTSITHTCHTEKH